jgi:hypothetical protein
VPDLSGNFADLAALAAASEPALADITTWTSEQENEVTFVTKNIAPSDLYITNDAVMQVRVCPILSGGFAVLVTVRVMRPDGTIMTGTRTIQPSGIGAISFYVLTLTEGFLLSVTVEGSGSGNGLIRGAVFVNVGITRTTKFLATQEITLIAGYLAQYFPLAWPAGRMQNAVEGMGLARVVVGSIPAVGTDFLETAPQSVRRILQAVRITMTTSSAIANRSVRMFVEDQFGNVFAEFIAPIAQTASQTLTYNFSPTPSSVQGNGLVSTPMCVAELGDGGQFGSSVFNIQAGDQLSAPVYSVQDWVNL